MTSVSWKQVFVAATGALICVCEALATPFWIAYEANDGLFPEQVGWTRVINAGGTQRCFEDGALVLDGRANNQIVDVYRMDRPGALDPEPGHAFLVQWRMRVDEVAGVSDPSVTVFSDESFCVALTFSESMVRSLLEPGLVATFQPHAWHDFELCSWDMRSYELRIDGDVAMQGGFRRVVSASSVLWGDGAQGSASLSRWEYFRFGAIPEPGTCAMVVLLGTLRLLRRRISDGAT